MIKLLLIFILIFPVSTSAGESFFFCLAHKTQPTERRIEGNRLYIVTTIREVDPPKVLSILVFSQDIGEQKNYQIQVNLVEKPDNGWTPMLKLGDDIIMEGVSVSRPDGNRAPASFSLQTSNLQKARN